MSSSIHIVAFYRFVPLEPEQLPALQQTLKQWGMAHGLRGLVLIAEEGINGTVCGTPRAIEEWKALMAERFGISSFNESSADTLVFPRWLVKIKNEIVAIKQPDIRPQGEHRHLSPAQWHALLEQEDVIVIDTRNTYETAIGTFEGAIDPGIAHFSEFASFAAQANLPKDKKILMCCTGGIRCEKAIYELEKHGYTDVYQLQGGILSYMKEFPDGKFKGECFVFDHRVAVGKHLEPSKTYALCPHCGNPGSKCITCEHCQADCRVCERCSTTHGGMTCSKACKNTVRTAVVA